MNIIITDYFKKVFKKTCKNISVEEFIEKINIDSKNFIGMKYPFYKFKISIDKKSYRVVIFLEQKSINLLAISIFDKKDKNFGENISWDISKNEILKLYHKNLDDIEQNRYTLKTIS